MKNTATTFTIVMLFALAATFAVAAPQDAQSAAGTAQTYTVTAANTYSAEGGNITEVNVSSDSSTSKWQGFWGNISGSLRLGDGSNVFYDWSGITFQAVYASPGNTLDWGTISDVAGQANREGKDTDYGLSSADPDSINQTMGGASCSAGTIFTAADGVTPYNSSASAGSWETCIGEDSGAALADTVFGTDVISAGADSFNGNTVQYQLMVPVQSAGTDYYFYLEI